MSTRNRLIEVIACSVVVTLSPATFAAAPKDAATTEATVTASAVLAQSTTGPIAEQPSPEPGQLLQFSTVKIGWMIISGIAAVYRTSDGGVRWRKTYRGALQPTSIDAVGAQDVWLLASKDNNEPAGIVRTKDGGSRWTSLSEPHQGVLSAIDFVGATKGWALTNNGVVLRTDDGGQAWKTVNVPVPAGTLCATSAGHVWLGSANGSIYVSNDSGSTWNQSLGYTQFLDLPNFLSATPPSSPIVPWLTCSESDAWALYDLGEAAGSSAYIVFGTGDRGTKWAPMLANQLTTATGNLPSVSNTMADLGSGADGFGWFLGVCGACGSTGTVDIVTATGTSAMKPVQIPGIGTASELEGASFVDPIHGWVVAANPSVVAHPPSKHGYRLRVVATVNGGRTWRKVGSIPAPA
jgi:Photosynthesis system II assembly factor YCF48